MNYKKIVVVILLITFVGILESLGLSQNLVSMMLNFLKVILPGIIFSGISEQIVEAFSGDYFKGYFLFIPIGPFNFSITVFTIVTIIVNFWLFK